MMDTLSATKQKSEVLVNSFVRSVYNWMFVGLAVTGFIAYYVSANEGIMSFIFGHRMVFWGILLAELALVFAISGMVNRMSAGTATSLFVLYSALNGLTLSVIFLSLLRLRQDQRLRCAHPPLTSSCLSQGLRSG